MIKTKQELLNHFSDINEKYNNPFMYQTLSNMIDALLEQQTCEDCISRKATVERLCKVAEFMNEKREGLGSPYVMAALFIQDNKDEFPSVTPKFTDAEIQKMQELEQAQLEKAYELGRAEIQPCDDCIRELIREFDNKHPALFANYMREFNDHPISEIIEYMWDMHDLIEDIKYRLPNEDEEESEDAE